jgi:hypothetical protein
MYKILKHKIKTSSFVKAPLYKDPESKGTSRMIANVLNLYSINPNSTDPSINRTIMKLIQMWVLNQLDKYEKKPTMDQLNYAIPRITKLLIERNKVKGFTKSTGPQY